MLRLIKDIICQLSSSSPFSSKLNLRGKRFKLWQNFFKEFEGKHLPPLDPPPSAPVYCSPGNAVHLEEPSRDSANFATPGLGVYRYISNEEGGGA
jgi:hypothetical protein